jgi:hypothetical protein
MAIRFKEIKIMDQELEKIINKIDNLEKRIEKLEKTVLLSNKIKKTTKKMKNQPITDIDFSLNERAFVKRYAADKSGPKKFVLLLAFLANGNVEKDIELNEIRKRWGKIKSMLGKFNGFHVNEAKTKGWVNSRKYGSCNLTEEWKDVLS